MLNVKCLMLNVTFSFNIKHSTFNIPRHPFKSAEQSLFLQFLTINTKRRPRNGGESLLADHVPAVCAGSEVAFLNAIEGLVDLHQETALGVGERKVELFRISAGSLVRQVLNAIIGQGVSG